MSPRTDEDNSIAQTLTRLAGDRKVSPEAVWDAVEARSRGRRRAVRSAGVAVLLFGGVGALFVAGDGGAPGEIQSTESTSAGRPTAATPRETSVEPEPTEMPPADFPLASHVLAYIENGTVVLLNSEGSEIQDTYELPEASSGFEWDLDAGAGGLVATTGTQRVILQLTPGVDSLSLLDSFALTGLPGPTTEEGTWEGSVGAQPDPEEPPATIIWRHREVSTGSSGERIELPTNYMPLFGSSAEIVGLDRGSNEGFVAGTDSIVPLGPGTPLGRVSTGIMMLDGTSITVVNSTTAEVVSQLEVGFDAVVASTIHSAVVSTDFAQVVLLTKSQDRSSRHLLVVDVAEMSLVTHDLDFGETVWPLDSGRVLISGKGQNEIVEINGMFDGTPVGSIAGLAVTTPTE